MTESPTTESKERISITVRYVNDAEGSSPEHLTHMVEWNHVPNQSKVWDRTKEMVDILYKQVRG